MNPPSAESRPLWQRAVEYPGHLRNWVIWKTGFCRQLRARDPIFVYQMGKVASRSICEPLQEVIPNRVVHGHRFDDVSCPGQLQELYRYWNSAHPPARMPIISLTRDPVDRNVSAFFQNYELYTGEDPASSSLDMTQLLECFLEVFPHDIPLIWFDEKIRKEFGLDVYSAPMSEEGVLEIPHERTPLLVLRMEAADEVKTRAVQEFLDIPAFSMERRRNVSGEKDDYARLYRQFTRESKLPAAYVERMIDSRYYRHFYGPDYEAGTRARWSDAAL